MKSNWEHSHAGVFTRDFDKTLKYYSSIGIAPLPLPRIPRPSSDKLVNVEFGKVTGPLPPGLPLQLLYIGDLELEVLHAPLERPSGEALAYAEGVIFGHALDGNVHFVFAQDFNAPREVDRYERFVEAVCDLVVRKYDGSLKAEHGTGRAMAPFVDEKLNRSNLLEGTERASVVRR